MTIRLPFGHSLRAFDPRHATRADWDRLHAFRHARQAETHPEDRAYPDALAEKDFLAEVEDPHHARHDFVVENGDRIAASLNVGWTAEGSPGYESARHLAHFGIHVLGPHRRQGIGTALVRQVLALTEGTGHTVLSTGAEEAAGHAFLRWLGFQEKSKGAQNRLELADVDWAMVEAWAAEGASRSPRTSMRFFQNRVPDETVDAFCAMRSELLNGMPFDDLDHGEIVVTPDTLVRQLYRRIDESGSTWHCAVALEPDGSIAGMTDVAYMPFEPDRIYQFLTGTRMDCRGRGLAKWLKAAMLLFVRNTYPDVERVITENASSNAGMLAINNRLGFKKHRGGSGYQIERSRLADLLAAEGIA
jgi:GNAT superfamily N-acetyltransferase